LPLKGEDLFDRSGMSAVLKDAGFPMAIDMESKMNAKFILIINI
jgi:hypothetical protein